MTLRLEYHEEDGEVVTAAALVRESCEREEVGSAETRRQINAQTEWAINVIRARLIAKVCNEITETVEKSRAIRATLNLEGG